MLKKYLLVFLVSMVPLIELRGSVPIGLSNLLGDTLPILPLYIVCIIGNMLPVPIIFFFARKVLVWGKDKKFIYFCWNSTSWYRCMDWNTCCKLFRYGF